VQELLLAGLTLTPSPAPGSAADRIQVLAQPIATIVIGMLALLAAVIAYAAALKNKHATLAAADKTDKRERENAERVRNREVMAARQRRYTRRRTTRQCPDAGSIGRNLRSISVS
jgi:hypothetical protein